MTVCQHSCPAGLLPTCVTSFCAPITLAYVYSTIQEVAVCTKLVCKPRKEEKTTARLHQRFDTHFLGQWSSLYYFLHQQQPSWQLCQGCNRSTPAHFFVSLLLPHLLQTAPKLRMVVFTLITQTRLWGPRLLSVKPSWGLSWLACVLTHTHFNRLDTMWTARYLISRHLIVRFISS